MTETCEIQRRVIIKVPHPSAIINDGLQLDPEHRARLAYKLDAALAWINDEFNFPEKLEDTYFRKYIKDPSVELESRLRELGLSLEDIENADPCALRGFILSHLGAENARIYDRINGGAGRPITYPTPPRRLNPRPSSHQTAPLPRPIPQSTHESTSQPTRYSTPQPSSSVPGRFPPYKLTTPHPVNHGVHYSSSQGPQQWNYSSPSSTPYRYPPDYFCARCGNTGVKFRTGSPCGECARRFGVQTANVGLTVKLADC